MPDTVLGLCNHDIYLQVLLLLDPSLKIGHLVSVAQG